MKQRFLVPEKMDDPSLDATEHRRALNGLQRVNWFSNTGPRLAKELDLIASKRKATMLSVLDIGCGGGDVACQIARSTTGKIDVSICGWDLSPTAIQIAREGQARQLSQGAKHEKASLAKVQFEVTNALEQHGEKQFDVVYCCLFLHHFTDSQAVELLAQMKSLARYSVIIDDLCRTRFGWWLAQLGCHLLSRSPVVHFDGPQSVRAAFLESEVIELADQAGLHDVSVRRHWPERFLLRWDA